ncbi:MAG: zf-TFIIB domain-containing protein [Bacteroidetes bacterium]|jgi:Zn-finger nucleic acid-binding protein|nr:zf-TFIIB domain-containing protein [Bacteroidota bacterium]MCB0605509.1 zf-TFIIB domain-containing protein [Saprospiraceae bacterium]
MKCPNCDETLLMTHRNNIEIDYCPKCRGVWLDKGELDKMLEAAAQQSDQMPNSEHYDSGRDYQRHSSEQYDRRPEYQRYSSDHKYHKPHKRKSFLGDLFDFD